MSLSAFYADRGGATSGESDFGVWWTDTIKGRWPTFRVSVVHETGDVYAIQLSGTSPVELLGTVGANGDPICASHREPGCAYARADELLDGWVDQIHRPGSLGWVRERLAAVLA